MKHLHFVLGLVLFVFGNLNAQVGIGTTTPDASSALDISSTAGGILIPRMLVSERIGITTPAEGLLVYQTDDVSGFYYFNGSQWVRLLDNNRDNVPTAAIFAFPTAVAPAGYLVCDGSEVSRTTYANLFAIIGVTYGNGNGSTTFNLPDYRGEFLRGTDGGSGRDPDAASRLDRGDGATGDVVGTKQNSETLSHKHPVNPPDTSTTLDGTHDHDIAASTLTTNISGNHGHTASSQSINSSADGDHNHFVGSTATNPEGIHSHRVPYSNITVGSAGSFGGTTIRQVGGGYSPAYVTEGAGNHNHTINSGTTNNSGIHNHTINIPSQPVSTNGDHIHSINVPLQTATINGDHLHSVDISEFMTDSYPGLESRPTNVTVTWCIKY